LSAYAYQQGLPLLLAKRLEEENLILRKAAAFSARGIA